MKLLLVDDLEINLKLLRLQLEFEGHQVVTARDGVEALEVLRREAVDGVISDILMPRMDGYRLCIEIRQDERWCELPFVFYAATYTSPSDQALGTSLGADAYIAKPAPIRELIDALSAISLGRRTRSACAPPDTSTAVMQLYNQALIQKLQVRTLELGVTNKQLQQLEARMSALIESAMDAIIAVDQAQRIVLFNPAAARMFGCTREEALDRSLNDFMPQRFRERHTAQVQDFVQSEPTPRQKGARRVIGLRADGSEFPIDATISKLDTERGQLCTVFIRDITDRVRDEARILNLNRVYAMLSGISSLIVRSSIHSELFRGACRIAVETGKFCKAWFGLVEPGRAAVRLVAWHGADDTFFASLQAQFDADPTGASRQLLEQAITDKRPTIVNAVEHHSAIPDPELLLASGSRSLVVLPIVVDGRTTGILSLHSDIPEFFDDDEMQLLNELAGDISFALSHLDKVERISYLANFDVLTGLPNRNLFTERLSERIRASVGVGDGQEQTMAIVLVDLEHFRRVNETLGKAAADDLLKVVASRLQLACPSAARIGVDLFVFNVTDKASVTGIAHALVDVEKRCFEEPFLVNGNELRVGFRGGVAVFPGDGGDAETLLRSAEAALRRAKASSEHCVFYAPEMNARSAEALRIDSNLRRAIERQEFVLHYQPKVNLADRRMYGVEALIRWQDPEQGLVPPMQFISILEETGLIGVVGKWALGQALADQQRWRDAGFAPLRVAVNVSALQLQQRDFAAQVCAIVPENEGDAIELEITESVIMDNVERNISALAQIRARGVNIAIDDFGTGYSSLAYIAKLPVTSLKIDRAFVTDMTVSPEGIVLVSSIIALAHALKLKVVAEGVETEEQARLLQLLACDEAQGYLFSRPVPASEIETLLAIAGPLPAPR